MADLSRSSGCLLHPASLPGAFGMGEIGAESLRWLETLERMGQRLWLIPPLHEASSFAGDPLLLAFESLRMDGVLLQEDIALLPAFDAAELDSGPVREVRAAFLRLAARRLLDQSARSPLLRHALDSFCSAESAWLDDWALFVTLEQEFGGRPWMEWPAPVAAREPGAMADAIVRHAAQMDEARALQFLFFRHWQRVRARAHALGVKLIGTVPFWPRRESADVWAAQELFELAPDGSPTARAAHDASAALYNWKEHRAQGYEWWRRRVLSAARLADVVHVSNLEHAFMHEERTGEETCWSHGPGMELIDAWHESLGSASQLASSGRRVPGVLALAVGSGSDEAMQDRAWHGAENLVIWPLHDLVGAASDSAVWRMQWEQLAPALQLRLRTMTARSGRL